MQFNESERGISIADHVATKYPHSCSCLYVVLDAQLYKGPDRLGLSRDKPQVATPRFCKTGTIVPYVDLQSNGCMFMINGR